MTSAVRSLILFTCLIMGHFASAQIDGVIGIDENSITGWACDIGENTTIRVHVYLNGSAGGGGTLFKTLTTNLDSEPAVHSRCKTNGAIKHRFRIPLTLADKQAHGGKTIYVHGISADHPNALLINSGSYRIPAVDMQVKGHVDSTTRTEDGLRIVGWACQNNVSQSTRVHVYSKQSRTFLGSYPANLGRGAGVQQACNSSTNKHGFSLLIPNRLLRNVRGETLNVHAIHLQGNVPNSVIANSESFVLPRQLYYRLSDLVTSSTVDLNIQNDIVRINRSINIRHLRITNGGVLRCGTLDTATYMLTTAGILVDGAGTMLLCGSNADRYRGTLHIRLKKGAPMGQSEAGIMAMNGGKLILHGKNEGTKWTRLAGNVTKGATRLRFDDVVNWKLGDAIAIGSSSYNMWQTEVRTVRGIDADKKGVTLSSGLSHAHRGTGYMSDGKWINLKAEVINLARNITIRPDGDAAALDRSKIGGHVMVMMGGQAFIRAVQFNRMGQMGRMARYPFHWHKSGNVAPQNQYFMDNSVINSYQRCVTVHQTDGARVQNNVCYNHYGHGYFLEDGNETNNKFYYNVGMLSRKVPAGRHLLQSDVTSSQPTRFSAPATFWISNPKNEFVGNVASGSEGTGFWHSFVQFMNCEETGMKLCRVVGSAAEANVFPAFERTLRFDGNVAHSANVGFNWDGAPIGPKTGNPRNDEDRNVISSHYYYRGHTNPNGPMPVFNNLHSYKNIYTGIYYRGSKSIFNNYRSADNGVHLFIAFSQEFNDGLIVGDTGQPQSERDFQNARSVWQFDHSIGMVTYDGPTVLRRVHFAGFPSSRTYTTNGKEVTPVPIHLFGGSSHYEHRMEDLSFSGSPYYKVLFDTTHMNWQDTTNHVRVRDVTGSIYGARNELIMPNTAILGGPGCRVLHGGRARAIGCVNYELGTLHHGWTETRGGVEKQRINFSYVRLEGPGRDATYAGKPSGDNRLYNKAGLILDKGYRYQMLYDDSVVRSPGMFLETRTYGKRGPVLSFPRNRNCSVEGAITRVSSMAALNSFSGAGNAYYRDANSTVHAVLRTRHQYQHTLTYKSDPFILRCP